MPYQPPRPSRSHVYGDFVRRITAARLLGSSGSGNHISSRYCEVLAGLAEENVLMKERILLTAAEVAELTGFSEGTIRHFCSQHRIPVVRSSSRCVRFRRSDIDSWVASLLQPADSRDAVAIPQRRRPRTNTKGE